jgi:hypothetical protein
MAFDRKIQQDDDEIGSDCACARYAAAFGEGGRAGNSSGLTWRGIELSNYRLLKIT